MSNKKLKICSLLLAVLMVSQLSFFCPCIYAAGTIDDLRAAAGELDKVRSLLGSGIDPNKANYDGWTPLHYAAKEGKDACVQLLNKVGEGCMNVIGWQPVK